ncbi:uncharacterized protein [Amphiura filiformis]|uniref:uncharacterized protein n=1 Tax=Amphiura filiformis TaxID=82378 RepID=UPI003B21A333
MASHSMSVKRLKLKETTIYPNLQQESRPFSLFKESASNSAPHQHIAELPTWQEQPVQEDQTYQQKTLNNILNWERCRKELIAAHFESTVPASGQKCPACSEHIDKDKHFRCSDCSKYAFFCSASCLTKSHNGNHLAFHHPQIWKPDEGRYHTFNIDVRLTRPNHQCNSQSYRYGVRVFDPQGHIHSISIKVCSCEKQAATFLRHQVWPSTVECPSLGFHVELLKWIENIMLESRASLLSICHAIRWKNNLSAAECNTLYRGLVGETFEQFRHFQYNLRTMEFLSPTLVDDVSCPACPKDTGSKFISLDANFGLVRKVNSGSSPVEPKHAGKIFVDSAVNERVSNNNDDKIDKKNECSNFQAGNAVRSKNKTANLDVTGVFGSCCRHGVPHTFLNIDRGEKLCYAIHVLDTLLGGTESGVKLHVLYDIACMLDRHIVCKNIAHKYENIVLAVPIFHAYGHKMSCQVKYSTRWLPGLGLTDGEEMERIWAYLRRFSFITKEMTPSHRIDLLTDGLLHYKRKKIQDMDCNLARNMEKANFVLGSTQSDLQEACKQLGVSIGDIDKWVQEEKEKFTATSDDNTITEEEKYVQVLLALDNVIDTFSMCDDLEAQAKLRIQHSRLEKEAKDIQGTQKIKKRWRKTDAKFKRCKASIERKKKTFLIGRLHKQAMEYKFIQNLQKKYSDGQSVAARLSKSLQRVTKGMKTTLGQYNNAGFENNSGGLPNVLTWTEVADPSCGIFKNIDAPAENSDIGEQVPHTEKQRLVNVRNMNNRAQEEKDLVAVEMQSALQFLAWQHNKLAEEALNKQHSEGVLIALREKTEAAREVYVQAHKIFTKYIQSPPVPQVIRTGDLQTAIDETSIVNEYVIMDMDADNDEIDDE